MPSTAIYDFFRYIKLYSPDGTTLEQTLEADSVTDSLLLRRSDGVSWNVPGIAPETTIAVTVGVDTIDGDIQGNLYLDGVEAKSIVLTRGLTYIFDQSDATNAGYGGFNHPLVFSNTVDGAVDPAISGQEYSTGVTYLIDDVAVTKADYKLNFTTTTNRKVKIELNDNAPTTFYYGTHDNAGQGGTITTTSGSDLMQINVDYDLSIPVGTTALTLTDVNANTSAIDFTGSGGIIITRNGLNELNIGSYAVAEVDTLHTVSTRNSITTNKLYIENIEIGNVTSAVADGFQSPGPEFLGIGTIDDPLRLAIDQRDITTNTDTITFTFTAQNAPGILHYTVGHQLDSGTAATSVTTSIQKFNGVTWDTLDSVTGVTGLPYEVSNMYNDNDSGSQYRVVYAIVGNTGTINLELRAYYEILEITDNPVIRTDTAVGTVWTRDLSPLGVNDIGRGSEPYDNVYANTFHGHLQGTFDGDLTGSLYSDDSTLLVDAINGIIYGTVDANINKPSSTFTATAPDITLTATNLLETDSTDLEVATTNNAEIIAGNELTLQATSGININSPVNTVIQGTAGFVGDLTGSVYGPDSATVIDNNGVVIGDINNSQVTTANLEASNFTDQTGTITGGAITDFSVQSPVYGTDTTTLLVDVANNQIVGEVNADTNKTGALTIASDTSVAVNGTGTIAFNSGVGVDADGKLTNSSNAAQPFSIASPVTPEKEFRAAPGIQEKMLYTNVTSGTYAIDTSSTQNVFWNQPSGALVANFTNLDTTSQRVRICRVYISQGSTAYIPTVEIGGVAQTPTDIGTIAGVANQVNIIEYIFYRTHTSTWTVYRKQIDDNKTVAETIEILNTKTGATGTVAHDFSTGAIFYHSSIAANFTANFTNIPTTNDRTISVVLILSQGATAYMPTAVQIDGTAETIVWQGGSAPSGTASGKDVVSFILVRTGSDWTVLGSATSYS